jgi:hypothetical protein
MDIIHNSASSITIRGPSTSDADFDLSAVSQPVVITAGSSSDTTTNDVVSTTSISATTDSGYELVRQEKVVGTFGPTDNWVNLDPGVASFDSTTGRVTRITDGTVRINYHTRLISRGVSLNVIRQGGQTQTVFKQFATGSLAAHITSQIDTKLTGDPSVRKQRFVGDPTVFGNFTLNTNRWTAGWDLSCVSPWNTYGNNQMTGVLVSPKHVLFSAHYVPVVGSGYGTRTIYFVAEDGEVISRTLVDTVLWHDPLVSDIAVLIMDTALPSKFKPAKFLPTTF